MSLNSLDRVLRARKQLDTSPDPIHAVRNERPSIAMPELPKAYWFGQISSGNMSEVPLSYLERSVSVFSAERMEAVWQQLLRRHEMLRAIIRQDGVIEIVEKTSKVFTVIDLRSATMEQARREVERLHETMIARERPLDEWPLFDAHAVQLPDGTTRLMFAFCIAVFDAFSWFIVEREANALYQDPNAALPPLPRYADHVAQATAAEAGPERQRAVAYWEDRLAALPRGPSLPPAMTASRKRWHHSEFRLSREFGDGFKQTARALGLSKYSLATAAFAEAVAAWSKSRHFVLTLLIQSRPTGFSSVIGNFSSTIALEVDFRGRRSFRQRARDLHRRFLQDLQHRAASGIYISREINRRSGRAPTAIFPVAFSALWNDETSKECASVLGSFQRRCLQVPDIAIDVGLVETTDGVVCNLDARADLFPAGMLPDLELVFRQLLIDLAAGPEVADRLRPVLPPPRDRALIAEVNRTGAPIDGRLLHEPFLEQVRRRPTATAVISPERTLTYADLDRYSAALAHRLRKLGLRPNELVAVPMLRGWQQAAAVLAIHRAGGAYVPIDLALVPHERMLHIFRHAQVRFAITQLDAAGAIDWPTNSIILTVESDDEPITSTPEQSWPRARPEDIAYVIYTSGSTGMPKGVTIDHRGALNTVLDINQRFSVGAHDRVLALSSLGFDLSVWDIFGMFAVGGTLVMPPASERPDPTEWSHAAREHGVTIWNSVPKLLDITIDNIGGRNELWPSTLRLVMLSGDWIPTSLPERARALSSSVELISLGGATEGSIWSIYFPIGTVDPTWRSIPYGRPLANQTFHVLDDALAPRPVWATGELYIGGIGLAQGYWADEDKTNASFIVHPETKERLYRTGDLGRYMPDGNIEFLGREDSQVKVRGYRVELGEIEAVITKLPGVRETYVLSREAARSGANDRRRRATDITQLLPTDHSVDKQLVAYVIPEPGVTLDTADLRARVAEMVPDYMVPTFLVVLTTGIPRSANGKVNRRELPPPEELGGVRAKHQLAPRDALETSLHALFCRVLGTDQLGVDDSFFELGGDSVMLVRVLSQIRQQHGREISVSAFALDPRVSSIARLIRERPDGNSAERSLLALRQDGDHDPLFLVHPVGGSGLAYLTLAQQIQPRRPIYALQSRGLESDDPPRETIEDMATAYLVAVKSVQPTGPYLLGGWSLGGTIAFEMAGQLHDRGEQASVLMIDSWAPNGFVTGSPIGESALVEWFRRDVTSVAGLARGTRELGPNRGALSPSLRRQFAVYSANIRAARSYEPKARAILISLIRASVVSTTFATHPALRNPSLDDRLLGWGALTARGIELQSCPGDHYSIISSHVDTLATLVDESVCLLDGDSRVDAHSRVGQ